MTYIGYIEQGKRHGTLVTYLQIVTELGYTLNDLIAEELKNYLSSSLAWELTQALASYRENEQESIVRIVEELTHMIRLFRVT